MQKFYGNGKNEKLVSIKIQGKWRYAETPIDKIRKCCDENTPQKNSESSEPVKTKSTDVTH